MEYIIVYLDTTGVYLWINEDDSPNPSRLISGVAWWDFFYPEMAQYRLPPAKLPQLLVYETNQLQKSPPQIRSLAVAYKWTNLSIYATRWDTKIGLGHAMDFIYSWIDLRSNLSVSRGRHVVCLIVLSIQVMYEVWQFWVNKCIIYIYNIYILY